MSRYIENGPFGAVHLKLTSERRQWELLCDEIYNTGVVFAVFATSHQCQRMLQAGVSVAELTAAAAAETLAVNSGEITIRVTRGTTFTF